jgi:radical SAM enzyme (TIGR01210 family)
MLSTTELPRWDDRWVLSRRSARPALDPWRPHAAIVEPERTRHRTVEDVATVFLTNRDCPFRCVMCDLWKYTTTTRVPDGSIPAQIEQALAELPPADHIKLYNAGNFFDAQAIPPGDLPRIAELVAGFRTVIIECHPLLVGPRCVEFAGRLQGQLQVAMGLETIHPEVLPRLNKRMTLADFARATRFLTAHGIEVRAFILLRPPLLDEDEGLEWAKRSVDWAFSIGVECCVIIPTRAGNGAMEELRSQGLFHPPTLASLERALAHGIAGKQGRVFADLWNIEQLFACPVCGPARAERLRRMNLEQVVGPPVACACGGSA